MFTRVDFEDISPNIAKNIRLELQKNNPEYVENWMISRVKQKVTILSIAASDPEIYLRFLSSWKACLKEDARAMKS